MLLSNGFYISCHYKFNFHPGSICRSILLALCHSISRYEQWQEDQWQFRCGSSDTFTNLEFLIYKKNFNEYLLWIIFQLANWEKTPVLKKLDFLFLFQLRKIRGKISETNWWNYLMNSLSDDCGLLSFHATSHLKSRDSTYGANWSRWIRKLALKQARFCDTIDRQTKVGIHCIISYPIFPLPSVHTN